MASEADMTGAVGADGRDGLGPGLSSFDDAALLARFAGGDRAALGELAGRHERAMLGLAKGLLGGDLSAAREVVQEAWVKVIRSAADFRGDAAVRTWMFRIVINTARDQIRRDRRRRRMRIGFAETRREADGGDGSSVDERERLSRAVAALGAEQREAVTLTHGLGLTMVEGAKVAGVSEGTFKSRCRAAMNSLRAALGDEGVA